MDLVVAGAALVGLHISQLKLFLDVLLRHLLRVYFGIVGCQVLILRQLLGPFCSIVGSSRLNTTATFETEFRWFLVVVVVVIGSFLVAAPLSRSTLVFVVLGFV